MTGAAPGGRCDTARLTGFCAGELGSVDREQVAGHLVDCESCWDEVRISRAAIAAVQRLHEPAPTALRAEVRATIAGAARAGAPPTRSGSHSLVLAAVAAIVLALSGVAVVAAMSGPDRTLAVSTPATSTSVPSVRPGTPASSATDGPVGAAIRHFGATPAGNQTVPAAPDLTALGLQHSSAGTVDVGGVSAICYVYAGPGGARLEVFVGAAAWARPAGSASVGAAAWTTSSDGLTVIGGPDPAQDQMLVITQDRATAVSAATSLGLT